MDEPDRLFERFRRSADTDALGRVFDATAPRLLQLAVHLVGDLAAAEDLVQATFVTAIEHAETFDASRKLESWLAGILANHARDLNKSARREIDPSSLAERIEATPLEHALDAEWSASLAQALDRVPEPYRIVLILRLQHGMEPTEIAHALQRSPGAVRVQLHRGRELLRKLLPAGLVAGALFIAEPGCGLAQVKAHVVAHAAAIQSGAGIAGITGGLLMSTKLLVSGAAIVIALFVLFLARGRTREPSPEITSSQATGVGGEHSRAESRDEITADPPSSSAGRVEAAPAAAPSEARVVKVHGRVFDSDTNLGIANAEIRFFAPQSARLPEIQRRWHDRFNVYPDGTVNAAWPKFGAIPAGQSRADTQYGTSFTNETRLGLEDLVLYAPPAPSVEPIARATTNASGEFEIAATESLGFLTCMADGYATRERAVAPTDVNKENSDDVTIRVAMREDKPLAGYVVDEHLKRIERRVRLRFDGHVNKPAPLSADSTGRVTGQIEKDLQMDSWVVETNPDGSFDCKLPAKMVIARCLEPDLGYVNQGFLRNGGTKLVDEVWPEPGSVKEPLVIELQSVASMIVRDRETQTPIQDIDLLCTRDSNGFLLRFGQFFAPRGRLRLARDNAVEVGYYQRDDELSACECTVWADGYLSASRKLHDLTHPVVLEIDLERGELPALVGRVHDGERALPAAHVSIAPSSRIVWRQPGGIPIAMSATDDKGEFRIRAPGGRYLMRVVAGDKEESRAVDLPVPSPIDVDFSRDTIILASIHDSSGAPCSNHPVLLRGVDGRRADATTDATGTARFSRLSAGGYRVQIMDPAIAVGPKPDQEIAIELNAGGRSRADFVIAIDTPRFARLVVEGSPPLMGWKARSHHNGENGSWADVEPNGRIPIDLRGKRELEISGKDSRDWSVVLPSDAADGHEIHVVLEGLVYEGIVTSEKTHRPMAGLHVNARPWNDTSSTAVIPVTVTDADGRFKLIGLRDEEYSISFRRDTSHNQWFEVEGIFLHTTKHPSSQGTQIVVALPRRRSPMFGGNGGRGFDGVAELTLTGAVHGVSDKSRRVDGYIGSLFPRDGYTLILYTSFGPGPDGTYELSVPAARSFAASIRDASTGDSVAELEWTATGTSDREVHDFELP
jgi:RNA polymerase sigma-70 factor (ECF subfamily)